MEDIYRFEYQLLRVVGYEIKALLAPKSQFIANNFVFDFRPCPLRLSPGALCLPYPPTPQDSLSLITDKRLTGGNSPLGFIKNKLNLI